MAEGVSVDAKAYAGIVVALTVLATVVVLLRFLVRRRQLQEPGWDDWTILGALVLEYAMAVEAILWSYQGKIGFRTSQLTPAQLSVFFQVSITYWEEAPPNHIGQWY